MSKLNIHRRAILSESGHQWFAMYQEGNLEEVIEAVFYTRVQAIIFIKSLGSDPINVKLYQ